MTTFIGTAGHMVPVGCVSTLSEATEDRTVYGGGEGTLSPRRARVMGPGARTWDVSFTGRLHSHSVMESLARRQSRYGGAYRAIPCDALDHNMLTPHASEDLAGWSGLVLRTPAQTPGVSLPEGVYPGVLGRVEAGQTAVSPRVPVLPHGGSLVGATVLHPETVLEPSTPLSEGSWGGLFGGVHLAGQGTLRVVARDRDGVEVSAESAEFPLPGVTWTLTRYMVGLAPAESAVSVELEVTAAASSHVFLGWPSIAYRETDYTPGRGCDQAYLRAGTRSTVATWGQGFAEASWQIVEVGV